MRFSKLLLPLVLILMSSSAWSAANLLSGVTTKRIGSDFFVEMTFTQDISDRDIKIQYLNKTIEMSIPTATTSPSRKITAFKDSTIDHLFTGRGSSESLRMRLVLTDKFMASEFEKTTSFMSKGNRVLLKIGNPPEPAAGGAALAGDMIDTLMKKAAGEKPSEGALQSEVPTGLDNAAQAAAPEDAQPVFKAAPKEAKSKSSALSDVGSKMVLSLLILGLLGLGAYYFFKKWPGAKQLTAKSRMIEVLAQHPLGPKKSVAVIRVAGEAVLVGVTDSQISILKTLSLLDEDIPSGKFQASLARQVAHVMGNPSPSSSQAASEDEFSMKGLKEIVGDRLRNMRNLS